MTIISFFILYLCRLKISTWPSQSVQAPSLVHRARGHSSDGDSDNLNNGDNDDSDCDGDGDDSDCDGDDDDVNDEFYVAPQPLGVSYYFERNTDTHYEGGRDDSDDDDDDDEDDSFIADGTRDSRQ
jgi:hypothetical protein